MEIMEVITFSSDNSSSSRNSGPSTHDFCPIRRPFHRPTMASTAMAMVTTTMAATKGPSWW